VSYTTNVVSNYQTAEYGKFVQYSPSDTRYPAISVTKLRYLDSTLFAPGCSYPPISSVDVFPKYAVLSYIANPEDFNITLSASNVDIGNVGIIDHSTGNEVFAQVTQIDTVGITRVGAVTVKTYGVTPVSGSITVLNPVTALQVSNTVAVSGGITVLSPITSVQVYTNSNTLAVSGNTTVTNTVAISTTQTLPVSVVNPSVNIKQTVTNWDVLSAAVNSSTYTTLPSNLANEMTLLNNTGGTIYIKNSAKTIGLPIDNNTSFDIKLVGNTSEVAVLASSNNKTVYATFIAYN
jgi:hypothetical protein